MLLYRFKHLLYLKNNDVQYVFLISLTILKLKNLFEHLYFINNSICAPLKGHTILFIYFSLSRLLISNYTSAFIVINCMLHML